MIAPLQLDDYWIDTLEIRAVQDIGGRAPAQNGVVPRLQFEIFRSPEGASYLIEMSIVLGKARVARGLPYHLRLKLSGVFSFTPDTPEPTQTRMIHINGPAILYGVARGIVAEATGAGRHGKYVLPSVNLLPMAEKRLAHRDTRPSPEEPVP